LQSIARSDHQKNLPLIYHAAARTPATSHSKAWFPSMARLCHNLIRAPVAMSVTLTNAEKQARYRERHLCVDGEKVRVGRNAISTPAPGRKWAALHATELYNNRSRRARRTAGEGKAAVPPAQGLLQCRIPRLWYNYISGAGAMSSTVTNAEK
jgi:hypothetical protein